MTNVLSKALGREGLEVYALTWHSSRTAPEGRERRARGGVRLRCPHARIIMAAVRDAVVERIRAEALPGPICRYG